MYDALTPSIRAWNARVLATIERCVDRQAQVDVDRIAAGLSQVAAWPGCPQATLLSPATEAPSYRRLPLGTGNARNHEALLIVWPPGHATPVHDHDGLWGMEFVLDGVLEVESFKLLPQPPIRLERDHSRVIGVGDHVAFSRADYAHRCRNLSRQRQALSLHVYGGELNRYRSFVHDRGQWSSELHQAVRESAMPA
ncbi:cysteine dioxygenase family protein [Rhodanobacter sp. DHB23]|uniref:cysteine dioxygenase n=1 Tax=Rhodanobacter sp. DHB23 TaxID=2775923 RepID=UPI00178265AD|nr:cysteine dioxygenase family protein [Rhodanobacter sp. DHB23]MBD8873815.1 cysteine dioxygenase family protein [Rhodanobacter sp. DHB23]